MSFGTQDTDVNYLRRLLASQLQDQGGPPDTQNMLSQYTQPEGAFGSVPPELLQDFKRAQAINGGPSSAIPGAGFQNLAMGQGVLQATNPDGSQGPVIPIDSGGGGQGDPGSMRDNSRPMVDTIYGRGFWRKDGKIDVGDKIVSFAPEGTAALRQAQEDRRLKLQKFQGDQEAQQAQVEHTRAQTNLLNMKPATPPEKVQWHFDAASGQWVAPPDSQGNGPRSVQAPGYTPPDKPLPQAMAESIIHNNNNIKTIDRALSSLETEAGKNAVGAKAYLPNAILNRIDAEGVNTRADIADIGSLQIKNRSGATVTVAEEPRLLPFIPLPTDDAATAKKKLTRLRESIQAENSGIAEIYPAARQHVARSSSAPILDSSKNAMINDARRAVANGADRNAVNARLQQNGLPPI